MDLVGEQKYMYYCMEKKQIFVQQMCQDFNSQDFELIFSTVMSSAFSGHTWPNLIQKFKIVSNLISDATERLDKDFHEPRASVIFRNVIAVCFVS
ncbi:unnamed protein product [Porites evermanni]|uniref:Uncharacterized protein n=1 Tax=Porites evermanni TaxID=104178 RepID=A0ABN8MSF5_9CNID|nr:unnamed protein product [Porites evermanni]